MAGGIQEGDGLAVDLHLIGADVLGDAAGLAGRDGGIADGIEKAGLAVVHMAHDHHHGSPGDQVLLGVLVVVDELFLDGDDHFLLHLAAHLLRHESGGIIVDELREGGHDAVLHKALHDLGAGLLHAGGQLAHADLVRDLDLDGGLLGDLQLETAHLLGFIAAALAGEGLIAALALRAGADLLLAAAALHPLAPLAAHLLQPLVVLGQVHIAALAGVHDLLLGDPGDRLLGLRLLRGIPLRGLLALLGGIPLLRLGRGTLLGPALRSGRRLGGLRGFRLDLRLGLLLLLVGVRVDHLDAGDGILLGEIVKNHRKLPVCQRLHMILGRRSVFRQDLHDVLGGKAEILRHLMHSVFFHNQMKPPRCNPARRKGEFQC